MQQWLRMHARVCGAIVAVALIGLGLYAYERSATMREYPEVSYLNGVSFDFTQYSNYLKSLAQEKGAIYAYAVMERATFPAGVSMHILAHTVGYVLYDQKGAAGITACPPYFEDPCSHSIVTGLLADQGPAGLAEIVSSCKKLVGGSSLYGICFHGIGHGLLAYTLYDFERAVVMCRLVGDATSGNIEYTECIGGVTMEMVSGVHDRAAWEAAAPKYLRASDPLMPCTASFMESAARPMCLIYLTPHLLEAAGMNLSRFDPAYFPKAFSYCAALPSGSRDRDACYNGFGKEFPVLSNKTYIKDLGTLKQTQLAQVRSWCLMAGTEDGVISCIRGALSSLFWGGQNTLDASFAFCGLSEGAEQERCYGNLVGYMRTDMKARPELRTACYQLPTEYRNACAR